MQNKAYGVAAVLLLLVYVLVRVVGARARKVYVARPESQIAAAAVALGLAEPAVRKVVKRALETPPELAANIAQFAGEALALEVEDKRAQLHRRLNFDWFAALATRFASHFCEFVGIENPLYALTFAEVPSLADQIAHFYAVDIPARRAELVDLTARLDSIVGTLGAALGVERPPALAQATVDAETSARGVLESYAQSVEAFGAGASSLATSAQLQLQRLY